MKNLKCSVCKEEKTIYAFAIQINEEKRLMCSSCYMKEDVKGNDVISELLTQTIRNSALAKEEINSAIALYIVFDDKKYDTHNTE